MTTANFRPNPFHLLGLSADATNEEIVDRAEELVQVARDDTERDRYAWARSELITHPRKRRWHEGTEPRDTDYPREQRWEDFVREHRRPPVPVRTLLAELPPGADGAHLEPADFDLPGVAGVLTRWLAEAAAAPLISLLDALPVGGADGVPVPGVRDVLFG